MIKVKAYLVPLGRFDKPVVNAFLILDIICLWFKRSICFHIHLKDIETIPRNGILIEHGWGAPNMSEYQCKETEVREIF